jgi:hypothetical protein
MCHIENYPWDLGAIEQREVVAAHSGFAYHISAFYFTHPDKRLKLIIYNSDWPGNQPNLFCVYSEVLPGGKGGWNNYANIFDLLSPIQPGQIGDCVPVWKAMGDEQAFFEGFFTIEAIGAPHNACPDVFVNPVTRNKMNLVGSIQLIPCTE